MRKLNTLSIILCFFILAGLKNSYGQSISTDSASQQKAVSNAAAYLNSALGSQSRLYNGPEFIYYDHLYKGNAYFQDLATFTPGTVYYDGIIYKGVPMLYDIYGDNVVALLYNKFSAYSLIKDRVKSFDLLGHHFVNINTDTLGLNPVLKSGYYDEIYSGKLKVLVRREKSRQNRTDGIGNPEIYFDPSTSYYLKKNNAYYHISSQSDMLNILKDKKSELQRYIKANNIKFRKGTEDAMVKIASYYDHLTN